MNFSKFIDDLGIDKRLLGMIAALILLWVMFDLVTGGRFLTPRNLFNLSVQTASVAVMATGMVFVIVARHIDLSVGSLLGADRDADGNLAASLSARDFRARGTR